MNTRMILAVAKRLGLWGALVLVVTLLTLLFNVLGTLTCAVAIGMMMGASGRYLRQAVLVSVVPPAVIVALALCGKTELAGRQLVTLALVCGGAFWLTYLLTSGLMCLERRSETGATSRAGLPAAVAARQIPHFPGQEPGPAPGAAAVLVGTPSDFGMAFLRGTWWSEGRDATGRIEKRLIEINETGFALSLVDATGLLRTLARGQIRLESVVPRQTLVLATTGAEDEGGCL